MKINFESLDVKDCDSCVFNEFNAGSMGWGDFHRCLLTKDIISDQDNYEAEKWKRKGKKFPEFCPCNQTKKVTLAVNKQLDASKDYDSKIDFDLID